ncbi:hypothetical protein [Thermoplasma volcanium GSS1]|uniref:Methyltransferase small domain-containing protein n=1 Tax=Thermoplasma volcanium (strain ATCC 51530 / DSM 4299 / JCM 9571 / NBRC 15438 / GSS1) TaxID=273116 RepID=Q97C34_THEVO|nr:50S ribosomal protein L11 methyltransferase [Thermoplasma volcanium]BAB59413.1 hypothetical protein [Thermoplasma volcanium GSS1]
MGIKSALEIQLQKLKQPEHYANYLEQYMTDASSAAYFLVEILEDGNIKGRTVVDAGTGNGILACGAYYLGAATVLGFDIDVSMVEIAKQNCNNVKFEVRNVKDISGKFDTWIMNPPFGSVMKHADRPFIEKAFETSKFIYSIGNAKAESFLSREFSARGDIFREEHIDLSVPRIYEHHKKDWTRIPAVIFGVKNYSF